MTKFFAAARSFAVAATLVAMTATQGAAAIVGYLFEDGGNVEATYSGTMGAGIGWTGSAFFEDGAFINPGLGIFGNINLGADLLGYGPSPLAAFGDGGLSTAGGRSGDTFMVGPAGGTVAVPTSYTFTSGITLSGAFTFVGATLASLGAWEGTYSAEFGPSGYTDTFTLHVGDVASVPVPASLPLMMAGFGALAIARRKRRG